MFHAMSESNRLRNSLLALALRYELATKLSLSTISRKMGHRSKFLPRLVAGDAVDFQISTYDADVEWFSEHWPEDIPWPPSVPRPPHKKPRG